MHRFIRRSYAASLIGLWLGQLLAFHVTAASPPACGELDRTACLESSACTSVLAYGRSYQCRPVANECQAFRQVRFIDNGIPDMSYDAKAACESRTGCVFVQGGPCYCPPGVTCVCGGGPPPDCVPAGEKAN